MSPPPPFISFPNIYRCRPHLTLHLLFHCHCPPRLHLCHCFPNFTIPYILSPSTFIVSCNNLEPLLPLQYACYVPLAILLSTFITPIQHSYSTSLLSLDTPTIAPLLPTPIFLLHFDLPRFIHLTSIQSNPIQYDHYLQICILNSDCSTHSPI